MLRRPWGVVVRGALLASGLIALASLRVPRPPTLCLLRATTGIPCPLCGFTTAAVHLGHADVVGAAAASPLAVAVCVGFVLAPLVRRSSLWRRWCDMSHTARRLSPIVVIVPVLVLSESWQLVRFGII